MRSSLLLASLPLFAFLSCSRAPEVTAEQRTEDIEFLARWAKEYSPMVPVNERYGGLPGCGELRPRYVDLARNAKDNREG